jgi:hypothetical protein
MNQHDILENQPSSATFRRQGYYILVGLLLFLTLIIIMHNLLNKN